MPSRKVLVILAIGAVSACSTAKEKWEAMATNAKLVGQQYTACTTLVYDKPEFASIRSRELSPLKPASMTLLTDETSPTPEEARLLLERHTQEQPCTLAGIQGYTNAFGPDVGNMLTQASAAMDQIEAALIQGRITWADAARFSQKLGLAMQSSFTQMLANIQRGLVTEERERNERIAQGLAQMSKDLNEYNRQYILHNPSVDVYVH